MRCWPRTKRRWSGSRGRVSVVASRPMDAPPEDVGVFGQQVAAALGAVLGDGFVGAYFVGSIALGGYVTGESDIDIVAVCSEPLTEAVKLALAEELWRTTTACPARGLEFTLYHADVASAPPVHADFEVNVNGGPGMDR